MSGSLALRATRLRAGYGRAVVLDGIDLQVAEGELVCILGPNGAGKTTLLSALAGMLAGTQGHVEIFGRSTKRASPEDLVQFGAMLVPETRDLFGSMTVLDNLLLGAFHRRRSGGADRRESLDQVFEWFPKLAQRQAQIAHTLSGGERQMLALGRAFMARPRLLLLDEPSLGLAPLIVRDIMRVVRTSCDQGMTVLLVEQNAHLALAISDRGYVMENGRFLLHGTAADLLRNDAVTDMYLGIRKVATTEESGELET